jgi:hypothetical protein
MFPKAIWYLYDDTSGNTVLKHRYREGKSVPCPHCGEPLMVENYRASCCGHAFKTSFGEIRQREPVARHNRRSGRGWASLRPYQAE